MNFYELINTLILSLSIATILITLVAFILYQIKRLDQGNKSEGHGIKLDSVFFRRFSPKREKIIQDWEENQTKIEAKRIKYLPKTYLNIGVLFGILAGVLAITLSLGTQGRKTISEITLAKKAEKIKILQAKGLLKEFRLVPGSAEGRSIKPDPEIKSQNLRISKYLKNKKIVLITNKKNRDSKGSKHMVAIKNWIGFLKKHKIPFKISTQIDRYTIQNPKTRKIADILIFPQHTYFSEKDRQLIDQLKSQVKLVFTGPVDIENKDTPWFNQGFDITFESNESPQTYFPSQFASFNSLPFLIPPGQVLPLVSTDNRYRAFFTKNTRSLALESDYDGRIVANDSKKVLKAQLNNEFFWAAWDPINESNGAKNNKSINQMADYVFLQALAHLADMPSARMGWWPDHAETAAVLSVNVEDEFENIENIIDIFAKHKVPSTLFLVADMYEKSFSSIKDDMANLELASHGDNHDSFMGQSPQTQFSRLQTSRHIIEEVSGQMVHGFHPPYEEMDDATLDSLGSNRLSYIFSSQQCMRLTPCQLVMGPVVFPKVLNDDSALIRNRTLVSPERILDTMKADVAMVQHTGGGYFLSLHTQIFGKDPYLKVVEGIIHELKNNAKVRFFTFNELASWWTKRSSLKVNLNLQDDGEYQLVVSNGNAGEINSLPVNLYNIGPLKRMPAQTEKISCRNEAGHLQCQINKIHAGETIVVPLDI